VTLPDIASITADELAARLETSDEIALLDVRERGVIHRDGTLLVATPLPLADLEARVARFVPRRSTPIVLIDNGGGGPAAAAASVLTRLGYTALSTLDGGTNGWAASGRELYTSVQALGQAFGEYLERAEHTPHATVDEVRALVDAGEDVLFLDSRPIQEFTAHSLPQGISAPGAEIVARGIDLITSPETVVVVNCAGRTRSIVGAQALINAGVPNRIVALEGGTMSWILEGHALAHGLHREAPAPQAPAGDRQVEAAARLYERFNIVRIDWDVATRLRSVVDRTTYLIDVRTPDEYEADHVTGSISAPSWDIAPWAFRHLATLNANIVVIDDAAGLRAALTGSWLVQLGWTSVSALLIDDVPAAQRESGPEPSTATQQPPQEVTFIEAADLHAHPADYTVIDLARSDVHSTGHIPGAHFVTRSALVAGVSIPGTGAVALTSPDGALAGFVAADLGEQLDRNVVVVAGGTEAWAAAGLTLESDITLPIGEVDDVAPSPWQQADRDAALRNYLTWEIALTEQLDRDTTTPFSVK
jgi:rhodanese-related sulfurtransferase